jgi:hypothetical protein
MKAFLLRSGLAMLLLCAGLATPLRAQAPLNDNPCGAILLTRNGNLCTSPTVGTNAGATPTAVAGHQNPTPGCGGGPQPHDVWYVFQTAATSLGSFGATLTVTGNPAGQLRLYAAPACTGPFTLIECSAATSANTAAPRLVTGALLANTYYYVAVNGFADTDQAGAFTICVTDGPGAPSCAAPYFLGSGSVNATSAQINFRAGANSTGPFQAIITGGGTTQTVTATATPLTVTGLTAATTYQVTLTGLCTSGGITPSAGLSFTTPTGYCTAGIGGSCTGNVITSFAILTTTLNNAFQIPVCDDGRSSGGGTLQAYTYYPPTRPSTTATLQAGSSYQASVMTDGSSTVSAWLDANHNGAFEPSEWTLLTLITQTGQVAVATLNVPATAVSGPTGLRVRSFNAGNPNGGGGASCVYSITGEVEDYTVTIAQPTATQNGSQPTQTEAYPNPAADFVTIAYARPLGNSSAGQLRVYNVLGQEVYAQPLPAGAPSTARIAVQGWASGLYSYRITWPDYATDAKKFVVAP